MKPKAKAKKKPKARKPGCNCYRSGYFCKIHEHLNDIYDSFIKNHKLKEIGNREGTGRSVYSKKGCKWVYKLPMNSAGIRDNRFEALAYKHRNLVTNQDNKPIGQYLAKCVLLDNYILRMEKLFGTGNFCNNVDLEGIDGGQGGRDKKRKYKLYDYSVNITLNGKYRGVCWNKKGTQDVLYI
jgi:hypothetical protein